MANRKLMMVVVVKRKHGHKLKLNDPETWLNEDEIVELEDPKLGRIKIQAWHKFHFRYCCVAKTIFDSGRTIRLTP